MQNFDQAREYIENRFKAANTKNSLEQFKTAFILGSGLGYLSQEMTDVVEIPTSDIPDYPASTVMGHKGALIFGLLAGKPLLIVSGRVHFYEGYTMDQVAFPVRLLKSIGIEKLILTNAAGGINKGFKPGDLMMITGYYDLLGNDLIDVFSGRVEDSICKEACDNELKEIILKSAAEIDFDIQQGIYAAMTGPSFETPSEIQFLAKQQADAVGMSTVTEIKEAEALGMKVAAISCISNLAAGISATELTHAEVSETAEIIKPTFLRLLKVITGHLS